MHSWKIFLLSLLFQLIITALLRFGATSPNFLDFLTVSSLKREAQVLVSPLVESDGFDSIRHKLEEKPNKFYLKKSSLILNSLQTSPAFAGADYDQVRAYLVVDLEAGEILAEKSALQKVPIASLTKIMSSVVALDLASSEENFLVPEKAVEVEPTTIGVVPGQKMFLKELLASMILTSANDGAEVVKEGLDEKYGQGVFVRSMNEKAKILGLKSTQFSNPQGYDSGKNYSSAADLAILSHYALENYPEIATLAQKDYEFLPENQNHKQFDLYNWNGLLGVYPGVKGLKIGNTSDAGHTIVVAAERDKQRVLVVLLGAPGVLERDLWASQLLDLGFEKLGLEPIRVTEDQLQSKYTTWKYWG